jgi:hypothetical protein
MIVRTVRKNDSGQEEFCFGHGYTDYKHEVAYVQQDIETALLEFKNDCFFKLNAGIDWKTRLGSHGQKEYLDEDIQNVVIKRDGVIYINNFQSVVVDRVYTCTFEVFTVYSEESINIEFTQSL